MRRERRKHSPEFKGQVALEALSETKTIAQIASEYGLHGNQVTSWKKKLKEVFLGVFETVGSGGAAGQLEDAERQIEQLRAKVGERWSFHG